MNGVRWAWDGTWLLLSAPYNAAFVAELKKETDLPGRVWDQKRKLWKVDPTFKFALKVLVRTHYGVTLGEPEDRTEGRARHAGTQTPPTAGSEQKTETVTRLRVELMRAKQDAETQRKLAAAAEAQLIGMAGRISMLEGDLERARRSGPVGALTMRDFLRKFGKPGYRAIVNACHPDRPGGDSEYTKQITAMWSEMT